MFTCSHAMLAEASKKNIRKPCLGSRGFRNIESPERCILHRHIREWLGQLDYKLGSHMSGRVLTHPARATWAPKLFSFISFACRFPAGTKRVGKYSGV